MVGPIGGIGYAGSSFNYNPIQYFSGNSMANAGSDSGFGTTGIGATSGVQKYNPLEAVNGGKDRQTGIDDPIAETAKKSECQTCKNRKYVDGSDEMVSFKSPAKINPASAMARVSAHEQEHVNNAYKKAEQNNGKVLQASVSIKTAICPECGKSYIAGGTTHTKILYNNESNPYTKNQKAANYDAVAGANIDATA